MVMKKGKKKGAVKPLEPESLDSFFEKSPFTCDSMIALEFKNGDALKIHHNLLQRNPKVAALATADEVDLWTSKPVSNPHRDSLKRISRSAGHIFVQYLYTDSYRPLKWVGPTPTDGHQNLKKTTVELEIAFEVYATARKFELDELEGLAREEITTLKKSVDPFAIIDVVKRVYPCAKGNDVWFPLFIKDTIRTAFETPPLAETELERENATPDAVDATTTTDVTLAKLLLQSALEIYREKVDALTLTVVRPTTPTPQSDGPAEPVLEVVDSEPEREPVSFGEEKLTEPEPVPVEEPQVALKTVVDDPWSAWGIPSSKKKKKKKGSVIHEPEPEPEPEPVPVEESQVTQKSVVDGPWGSSWGIPRTTNKKKKKKGAVIHEPEPEPEPVPVEEPEPVPIQVEEPDTEPVPVEEPQVLAEPAVDDTFRFAESGIATGEDDERNTAELEPEPEALEEPACEPCEPEPELGALDEPEPFESALPEVIPTPALEPEEEEEEVVVVEDFWGTFVALGLRDKSVTAIKRFRAELERRVKLERERQLVPEPVTVPEIIPIPEPIPVEEGHDLQGITTEPPLKKKGKKWKIQEMRRQRRLQLELDRERQRASEPAPETDSMPLAVAVEKCEVIAEPAPSVSPVEDGWVGAEPDPWTFWGAKKSPRSSIGGTS